MRRLPAPFAGRTTRRLLVGALALAPALLAPIAASGAPPALSYTPPASSSARWWGTNGRVTDILPLGGRVYLSGGFDYVGPSTGYGVGVNGSSGVMLSGAPQVDGPVYAAAPDGAGGWYIGGTFSHVGGVYRPGAARVTSTGALTGWNPVPKGGGVYALAVSGTTVYLGGSFTALGTAPAGRLAAVDGTKGTPIAGWSASANSTVRTLLARSGALFAGGDFTVVNSVTHNHLVKLSGLNGAVTTTFAGSAAGSVLSLGTSPDGTQLYGGGSFTAASGGSTATRSRLAAWDSTSGALSSWAPAADNTVSAVAVDPATGNVFAGGLFSVLAGTSRSRLGGLTPAGTATSFNASLNGCQVRHTINYAHTNPPCTPEVDALTVSGSTLYVGGRFGYSGATSRHDVAAFATSNGALTAWDPVAGDRAMALAGSSGNVFVGGEMTSVNGAVRKGVAALNASTGALDTTFRADTDNEVLNLLASTDGSRLYLAGAFLNIQGQARSRMAAIDTATGLVDSAFRPSFNDVPLVMGLGGGSLFAAGQFTSVNGLARSHTVKLNALSGAVDGTFIANTVGPTGTLRAGGMVQGMAVKSDGSLVFLGGPFTTVNGAAVPGGLAVVSGTTGALSSRQLGGVQTCSTVGPWVNYLYLSPDGKRLYGGDVCPDYIYQWDAVNLSTSTNPTGLIWRAWCNGGMQGALEVNGDFYYGTHAQVCGTSLTATSYPRARFAVFNASTGALLPDAPAFGSAMGVWSLAAVPQGLLVGGDFAWAVTPSWVTQGLVLFPGTP